jgi:hypothetical protein
MVLSNALIVASILEGLMTDYVQREDVATFLVVIALATLIFTLAIMSVPQDSCTQYSSCAIALIMDLGTVG